MRNNLYSPNDLGYAVGDTTYIFKRFNEPERVTVTKVTKTGMVTVESRNYCGQTVHIRFTARGWPLGSAGSRWRNYLIPKAALAAKLADVEREIREKHLRQWWETQCNAAKNLDPIHESNACMEQLNEMLEEMARALQL